MENILIKNALVIPMDKPERVIEDGYVSIEGNKITGIGKTSNLKNQSGYEKVINAKGKAVLPGIVNAHTHLATECFRGITDIYPEMHFTFVVKNFFGEKQLYDLSLLGCLELMNSGTTCTGDNYQRSSIIAKSFDDAGLRGVVSEQITQADLLSGIYPAIFLYQPEEAVKGIKANEDLIKKWSGAGNGRITCMYGPHAPDTLTTEVLEEIKGKAGEKNVGIMIHIAQSTRELSVMRTRHRMTSVEYLEKTGILGPKTVGAHCVFLTPKDIEILRKTGTHIAHCPNNFIRRGNDTPLIPWLRGGITNIGFASDNILHDPWELMRFSNYLSLFYANKDPTTLHLVPTPYETLDMSICRSAKALGLDKEIGTLEVGKKADIILVDLKRPHLVPNLDIFATLVHYANGNDVDTTIIDGKIVKENKILTVKDADDILENGQKASEHVWSGFIDKYPQFPEVKRKLEFFRNKH